MTLLPIPTTNTIEETINTIRSLDLNSGQAASVSIILKSRIVSLIDDAPNPLNAAQQYGITTRELNDWTHLARIPEQHLVEYCTKQIANGKTPTTKGARRHADQLELEGMPTKPTASTEAFQYTTPPIDVNITTDAELSTSEHLHNTYLRGIIKGLKAEPNPRHVYVFCKYTGIKNDGTIGRPWKPAEIAEEMGVTREYASSLIERANNRVKDHIITELRTELRTMLEEYGPA